MRIRNELSSFIEEVNKANKGLDERVSGQIMKLSLTVPKLDGGISSLKMQQTAAQSTFADLIG